MTYTVHKRPDGTYHKTLDMSDNQRDLLAKLALEKKAELHAIWQAEQEELYTPKPTYYPTTNHSPGKDDELEEYYRSQDYNMNACYDD